MYNGFAGEGRLHRAPKGTDYYDYFSLWGSPHHRCARHLCRQHLRPLRPP
ncbi:hypothetical protein [Edaphobacter sp. HDX4]